jgi:hypothetical protein
MLEVTLPSDDLADVLAWEFESLYEHQFLPNGNRDARFSGVLPTGQQFILPTSPLGLDHIQKRQFFSYLCRKESLIGYVYASPMYIERVNGERGEQLQISASTSRRSVVRTLDTLASAQAFTVTGREIFSPYPENVFEPYVRLISTDTESSFANILEYDAMWSSLRDAAFWRDRA